MKTKVVLGASALLLAVAVLLVPGEARACGGLFCNSPPPNPFDPLPVAQTGENVVFAVSTDSAGQKTVEAHIQVFYTGPAAQFSWVVPVDAVPTVSVGSDQIFTTVAARTAPQYTTSWVTEGTCKPEPYPIPGAGGFNGGTGSGGSTSVGGSADAGTSVQVAFRGNVGPYDTAVIQSGDAAALLQWLADNGFFVGDNAKQIIAQYVQEQKAFVAIKLLNGKDVSSIQPVVLKFSGSIPCVPLRLTAIAALADLQVNLWVLGDSRAVPQNYLELTVNEARLDWLNGVTNYADLVKKAADEATGNAFIAEYAGTARIMDKQLWPNTRIDLAALQAASTPPAFLQQVVAQGLTQYAQTLGILETFIPEPQVLKDMGISEATFYNQAASFYAQYQSSFAPFDSAAAAAEFDKVIVMPLQAGQALFDAHPYLTRLSTYISPEEMTKDPLFIFNSELPDLSNVHAAVAHRLCGNQLYRACEAPVRLETPGGLELWFVPPPATANTYCYGTYDHTDLDKMPALDVAFQRTDSGEGTRVRDNGGMIAAAVTAHNKPFASAIGRVVGYSGNSGCSCRSAGGGASVIGGAALLLALVVARRRANRRR